MSDTDKTTKGWMNGFLGVLIFSGSLPATRLAVAGFDPFFLTFARACIAGGLGLLLLIIFRERRPPRGDLLPLVVVAFGVVIAFPLLTALALKHITAAHSVVFAAVLPLTTAIFGVSRGGERPNLSFWVFSGLGAAFVAGFALMQSRGSGSVGDILMIGAVIFCGLGYAEGGRLSRRLGGWQVISWALVISLPVMIPAALATLPNSSDNISAQAWLGLGYVSVFSMLIGFVFWYRGLAEGGIAAVGQLQLLQPFFGLLIAARLLHEPVGWSMVLVATAVVFCVIGAKRCAQPLAAMPVRNPSKT